MRLRIELGKSVERLGNLIGAWGLRFVRGLGFKVDVKGCACSYSELECNAALWEEAMETKAWSRDGD